MNPEVNQQLKSIIRSLDEASQFFKPFTKDERRAYIDADPDALMYHGPMEPHIRDAVAIIYHPKSQELMVDIAAGDEEGYEEATYEKTGVKDMDTALRLAANAVRDMEDSGIHMGAPPGGFKLIHSRSL